MRNYTYILILTFLICGCNNITENKSNEIQNPLNNVKENNSRIITPKDSIQIYKYPNLTVWGGLTLKSINGKLKIVDVIHNAELGFSKRIFYVENDEVFKIEYIGHHAEWSKYERNFPSEKYEWDPKRMTYSDTTFIIDLKNKTNFTSDEIEKLKLEGVRILEFIKKEKIGAFNTKAN